jgi:DNA-binding SARP family transcriptional activator
MKRLITAHALTGNRAGALQAYQACQAVLKAELGIVPSPETEHLRLRACFLNQIREKQPGCGLNG